MKQLSSTHQEMSKQIEERARRKGWQAGRRYAAGEKWKQNPYRRPKYRAAFTDGFMLGKAPLTNSYTRG